MICVLRSQESVIGALTTLWVGEMRNRGSIPGSSKIFLFAEKSRLVLETTQLAIQSVMGAYSQQGVKRTTHTYLISRLRMSGAISQLSHMPSYHVQQHHLYNICTCNDVTDCNNQEDNEVQNKVIIKFLKHKRPIICVIYSEMHTECMTSLN
jgi:hypothetical protein